MPTIEAPNTPLFLEPCLTPEPTVPVRLDLFLASPQRNERVRIIFGDLESIPDTTAARPRLDSSFHAAAALARGALYMFVIYHELPNIQEDFFNAVQGTKVHAMLHETDNQAWTMHTRRHPDGLTDLVSSNGLYDLTHLFGYEYDGFGSFSDELCLSEAASLVSALGSLCRQQRLADSKAAIFAKAKEAAAQRLPDNRSRFVDISDW